MKGSCINEEQLCDYLAGHLDNIESAKIEQHLSDCDVCLQDLIVGHGIIRGDDLDESASPSPEIINRAVNLVDRTISGAQISFFERIIRFFKDPFRKLLTEFNLTPWPGWSLSSVRSARNVVSEDIVVPMHHAATDFQPDVDEFEVTGLTAVASQVVKPPRVKESPINLECQLYRMLDIGDDTPGSGTLVIGEIIVYHIDDEIFKDGYINTTLLNPVGKLAGLEYTTLGNRFKIEQ